MALLNVLRFTQILLSLQCDSHTTQLAAAVSLAEGALNPTVHVIKRDAKQHQSQYPLRILKDNFL